VLFAYNTFTLIMVWLAGNTLV